MSGYLANFWRGPLLTASTVFKHLPTLRTSMGVCMQERCVTAMEWLPASCTVICMTWAQSSTTLLVLVRDSKQTGLANVHMHACRVLVLRLRESHQCRFLPEGSGGFNMQEEQFNAGVPHIVLHPEAIASFWQHACYRSRLKAPLDTLELRQAVAEGTRIFYLQAIPYQH